MGSKPCLKSCGECCSLSFEGKKSSLEAEFEGPQWLWEQAEVFFGFARSLQAFCVIVGQKRAPYDKVMAVLVNTGPLFGSP